MQNLRVFIYKITIVLYRQERCGTYKMYISLKHVHGQENIESVQIFKLNIICIYAFK